jgi:hypothetical protein
MMGNEGRKHPLPRVEGCYKLGKKRNLRNLKNSIKGKMKSVRISMTLSMGFTKKVFLKGKKRLRGEECQKTV